jgi:hypothetical protein
MLIDQRAKSSRRFEGQQDGEGQGTYRMKRRIGEFSQHDIEGMDYASLLPILKSSTGPLRQAASEALKESIDLLPSRSVNSISHVSALPSRNTKHKTSFDYSTTLPSYLMPKLENRKSRFRL